MDNPDTRDPRLDRFQERCRGYAAALLPHSKDEKVWDAAMTYLDLSEFAEKTLFDRLEEIELILHNRFPDAEEPKKATADWLFGVAMAYSVVIEKLMGRKTETEENEK